MAANSLKITALHKKADILLKGDMSVDFEELFNGEFSIQFFTTTDETFTINSTIYKFLDLKGAQVNGLVVGGQPGCFLKLALDVEQKLWYIVANNLINNGAGSGTIDIDEEVPLAPVALPAMTIPDYEISRNRRIVLTRSIKLGNPVNMKPGKKLTIVLEQDATGSRTVDYDNAYGFVGAVKPDASTTPEVSDVFEAYMRSDWTLICDLKKGYAVIRPIAYGLDFAYTMQAAYTASQARAATENGQNVLVIRDGYRLECNGSVASRLPNVDMRIKGVKKANGKFPTLRLDKNDRPAGGKAMVNIEGGRNVTVEDLIIAGAASTADGNGTGILFNPSTQYGLVNRVSLLENENGIRTTTGPTIGLDIVDTLFERNGWSWTDPGKSHSIYAGYHKIVRALRSSFYDPSDGHNIKSRTLQLVLRQVYARKSKARELDQCDQGVVHVYDSVFWKESSAVQNNLIGIGHERLTGKGRPQEYFFYNCYFHNDVSPVRDVTFLENMMGGSALNTVAVHFIDCEFGGAALIKPQGNYDSLFKGPYTITLTDGPLGPRVPVGSPTRLFNMAERDPNRKTNPAKIELTPLEALPPMTELDPMPPYPTYLPVQVVPPLPVIGANQPPVVIVDKTPPNVTLEASHVVITEATTVTLTADATDDIGIAKVEFYLNDVLVSTDTVAPYTLQREFTSIDDNGKLFAFTAKAYDTSDKVTTSNQVVIRVEMLPPDEVNPEVTLTVDQDTVVEPSMVTLTADATDDRGVDRVEFYRGEEMIGMRDAAPYEFATALAYADNGSVTFTAMAYDAAGNVGSSSAVTITVDIPPPPVTNDLVLSGDLLQAMNDAIAAADSGVTESGKRVAAANALINAMAPNHTLSIFRDGVEIIRAEFPAKMELYSNEEDIGVALGEVGSSTTYKTADINTGSWIFTIKGGPSDMSTIDGSVGPIGSNKDLILEDSTVAGQVFDQVVVFLLHPSIDGVS